MICVALGARTENWRIWTSDDPAYDEYVDAVERADVTVELVQGLLRRNFPGITVKSTKILNEVHGTAANLFLDVDREGADTLPNRMWLKAGLPSLHLDRVLTLGLFAKEAKFYSELQPRLNMRLPECYAALADDASGRGVVLLEDVKDHRL